MVFIKKAEVAKDQDFTIAMMTGRRIKRGQVGLEVEVEGRMLPRTNLPSPWVYVQDGSLRGAENAEYIFNEPIAFKEIPAAIDVLWEKFKTAGSKIDESNRTSVHVHLNVLGFHQNRLTALMALWLLNEDVLTRWCGDYRVGNLFCLRGRDAHAVVTQLKKYVESNGTWRLNENIHHYAAMNAYAITKFGSLEFRTLRGVTEPEALKTWVSILKRLYDLSAEYKDPRTICEDFSLRGSTEFFRGVFGHELAEELIRTTKMSEDDLRDSLYEGIRLAQDLCYARDWSEFNAYDVPEDPFGRKVQKKTKTATAALNEYIEQQRERLRNADDALTTGWRLAPEAPRPRDANPIPTRIFDTRTGNFTNE